MEITLIFSERSELFHRLFVVIKTPEKLLRRSETLRH